MNTRPLPILAHAAVSRSCRVVLTLIDGRHCTFVSNRRGQTWRISLETAQPGRDVEGRGWGLRHGFTRTDSVSVHPGWEREASGVPLAATETHETIESEDVPLTRAHEPAGRTARNAGEGQ